MAEGSVVTMQFINGSAEVFSALPFFCFSCSPLNVHFTPARHQIKELWSSNPGSMVTMLLFII